MPDCTCPKRANDRGAIECVGIDRFCPMHGPRPSTECDGCHERDKRIAELESRLAAFESIVQAPAGTS
jgi:hypothetical protein